MFEGADLRRGILEIFVEAGRRYSPDVEWAWAARRAAADDRHGRPDVINGIAWCADGYSFPVGKPPAASDKSVKKATSSALPAALALPVIPPPRKRGRPVGALGRKTIAMTDTARRMKAAGATLRQIERETGLGTVTLKRVLRQA